MAYTDTTAYRAARLAPAARRHDVDWLRVTAIGLLIVYLAMLSFTWFAPLVAFVQVTPVLDGLGPVMDLLNVWRIPTLFVISGTEVSFAALGLAATYLNRPSSHLSHLSEAVLPVYIVHLPVQSALAYGLARTALPPELGLAATRARCLRHVVPDARGAASEGVDPAPIVRSADHLPVTR